MAGQNIFQNADGSPAWGTIITIIVLVLLYISGRMSGNGATRTDGVFESATEKIDAGRADTLTEAERQRIHDLTLGWCNKCNTAHRLCKHGK